MRVQTWQKFFNERIDGEMSKNDMVEDTIQNAILTLDDYITVRVELAVRSINMSAGRDGASVTGILERVERIGIVAFSENAFESRNTFHELDASGETRRNVPDEASELPVSGTQFDQQPFTHHTCGLQQFLSKRFGQL